MVSSAEPTPEAPDDEAPASTTSNKPLSVHVTSIPDVCMTFPSGQKIFANVAVLRNASPVFRAMLGPDFKEGHAIINNPRDIQEITFPEDDPRAMLAIAQLLHHNYENMVNDDKFTPKRFHSLAVHADKYIVCHVVKPFFGMLVSLDKVPCKRIYLLSAAYILGDRDVFKKVSSQLLRCCNVPFMRLVKGIKSRREQDIWIGGLLEEKRAMLRSMLSSQIFADLELIGDENPSTLKSYTDLRDSILVSYDHTLGETIEKLKAATSTVEDTSLARVKVIVRALEDKLAEGICYDCVGSPVSHKKHGAPNTETT